MIEYSLAKFCVSCTVIPMQTFAEGFISHCDLRIRVEVSLLHSSYFTFAIWGSGSTSAGAIKCKNISPKKFHLDLFSVICLLFIFYLFVCLFVYLFIYLFTY